MPEPCQHSQFAAKIKVFRRSRTDERYMTVTLRCADCGEPHAMRDAEVMSGGMEIRATVVPADDTSPIHELGAVN